MVLQKFYSILAILLALVVCVSCGSGDSDDGEEVNDELNNTPCASLFPADYEATLESAAGEDLMVTNEPMGTLGETCLVNVARSHANVAMTVSAYDPSEHDGMLDFYRNLPGGESLSFADGAALVHNEDASGESYQLFFITGDYYCSVVSTRGTSGELILDEEGIKGFAVYWNNFIVSRD